MVGSVVLFAADGVGEMPVAKSGTLKLEKIGVGIEGFGLVHREKVEDGAGDVSFVVFARLKLVVVEFAVRVDISGRNIVVDVGFEIPFVG